jgi:hypothetical protein
MGKTVKVSWMYFGALHSLITYRLLLLHSIALFLLFFLKKNHGAHLYALP